MRCIIYTDGSYIEEGSKKAYGCGVYMLIEGSLEPIEFGFGGNDADLIKMRNVAGELCAAINAVDLVTKALPECNRIDLYFGSDGVEKWVTGEWRANKPITIAYRDYMRGVMENTMISFHHVKGHSGDRFNQRADELARQGAEDYLRYKM